MIHVSQFYSCSKVKLAAELLYICELGKYLKEYHDEALSLDGVILDDCLKKSKFWTYFQMSIQNGWIINHFLSAADVDYGIIEKINLKEYKNVLFTLKKAELSTNERRRRLDRTYEFHTPIKTQVVFDTMTEERWLWTFGGSSGRNIDVNTRALFENNCNQAWVSLVAFVAVRRLMKKSPLELHFVFDYNIAHAEVLLAYFMMLHEETSCFRSWCSYEFKNVSSEDILHMGYVSWFMKGLELGYLKEKYTVGQKLKYLKELDIEVGDLVMVYKRNTRQKRNFVKSVSSCHLAIVRGITGTLVRFEMVNTVKTKAQGKADMMEMTTATRQMYMSAGGSLPYEKFNSRIITIDLCDLGIQYLMDDEPYFIVPLSESEDDNMMYVDNGSVVTKLPLTQNERAYWILKDYGVSFNEEKFLNVYFGGVVEKYVNFMTKGV